MKFKNIEGWKDVIGYEGIYQVSDLGNVRSLDRIINYSNGGKRLLKGRILKPGINSVGYYIVGLHKNRNQKTNQVHQLVAESFLGHTPCGYDLVVNHINKNKLDNNLYNLEVITHRENISVKSSKNTSKHTGVYFRKDSKKWSSRIYFNGALNHLGCFKNEYEAHLAYQKKLKEIQV